LPGTAFIVVAPMLKDGKPKDLFVENDLHTSPAGYEIWTQVVKAALLPQAKAQERSCRRAM
jgi:hypothetical protein